MTNDESNKPPPPLQAGKNQVRFNSHGNRLAGLLFLPAMIFSRPVTGVKEQTIGYYAERFCKEGNIVSLAFDPTGWGESAGTLRNVEHPDTMIADGHMRY